MGSKTYFDKPTLWVVIVTIILIIAIVTAGVLVRFFVEEFWARIILICLIVLLSVIGLSALTILEIRWRKIEKKSKNSVTTKNGYLYENIKPSAPRDSSWEYSNRETMSAK